MAYRLSLSSDTAYCLETDAVRAFSMETSANTSLVLTTQTTGVAL